MFSPGRRSPPPPPSFSRGVSTKKLLEATSAVDEMDIEEDHPHVDEGWLVAYADMMTLLFGLFVLLYSMSTVDQEKFESFRKQSAASFGSEYQNPVEDLNKSIAKQFKELSQSGAVTIKETPMGIEINIGGELLFSSAQAEFTEGGQRIIDQFADAVKKAPGKFLIRVEGHSDDVPITTEKYPSNWELSSARATLVVRQLIAKGFDATKLEAIGYAETRPIAPNRTPSGEPIGANRAKNRRVFLKVITDPSVVK
jgi:chemotaxis protein MotB